MRFWIAAIRVILPVGAVFFAVTVASAQMTYRVSVFTDFSFNDDLTQFVGTSSTVDDSTGCVHHSYGSSVTVYGPNGAAATGSQPGFVSNTTLNTSPLLGWFTSTGAATFTCTCYPYGQGYAGGQATSTEVTEFQGCKIGFSPGQFNAECDNDHLNNESYWVRVVKTTAPQCIVTTPVCSAVVNGPMELGGDGGINCQVSYAGGVSGHVYFFAGDGGIRYQPTVIGNIRLNNEFSVNGNSVTRNDRVNVVCPRNR